MDNKQPSTDNVKMRLSPYNKEQVEAIHWIRRYLANCSDSQIESLIFLIKPYLSFRKETAEFQNRYLSEMCIRNCFTSWTSACCGREGIMTFFADMVINILISAHEEIEDLVRTLLADTGGTKCVYLSNERGCLWKLKPIVCEMFLCDKARDMMGSSDQRKFRWEELRRKEKYFTWPDKPVLFDDIEEMFIKEGIDSPLMYFHKSPGLLRIKKAKK